MFDWEGSNLHVDVIRAYESRLQAHISAVQVFGRKIGVPEGQLEIHDNSKWSKEEFEPYAKRFCTDLPKEETAGEFAIAWLNHIHLNPHHWNHWMFADGFNIPGANLENGVARMPNHYALEMIADWHGASFAYTGSWDIQSWLWENMPKITLHSETADYVRGQLDMLSYADTVYVQRFAHEAK